MCLVFDPTNYYSKMIELFTIVALLISNYNFILIDCIEFY